MRKNGACGFDRADFNFYTDDIEDLPSETSLQRKIKELCKWDGRIGSALRIVNEENIKSYGGEI